MSGDLLISPDVANYSACISQSGVSSVNRTDAKVAFVLPHHLIIYFLLEKQNKSSNHFYHIQVCVTYFQRTQLLLVKEKKL